MSTATHPDGETPLVIDFDDNRLLTELFGEHDRNLARIEQKLGVSLVPRGNRVAICSDGSSSVSNTASSLSSSWPNSNGYRSVIRAAS